MKVIKTAKFIAAKNVINNPENIRNVLDLYQKGYNQHRIAKTLNLAYNTVGRIFAYNHWRSPRDVLNAINLQYAQKYNRTPMASKKEYLQTLPPEKRLNFMSNFIDNIFGPQTENTEFWNKIKEIASDPDAPRGGIFSGTPEEMNIQEKCPCCGVKRNQATKRRFLNKQINAFAPCLLSCLPDVISPDLPGMACFVQIAESGTQKEYLFVIQRVQQVESNLPSNHTSVARKKYEIVLFQGY